MTTGILAGKFITPGSIFAVHYVNSIVNKCKASGTGARLLGPGAKLHLIYIYYLLKDVSKSTDVGIDTYHKVLCPP